MIDLKNISGLEIRMEESGHLVYDGKTFSAIPSIRMSSAGKSVYLKKNTEEQDLYYMYRYFEKVKDIQVFLENKLEYDVTVIKNGVIGDEYIKTIGHYHGMVPDQAITYPEVYEVIQGNIDYILQTQPINNNEVDVIIVRAETGDKIVVPPNYGHVSVNTGKNIAVSSNVQMRDLPASSDYDFYTRFEGAAIYEKVDEFCNNPHYIVRSMRMVKAKDCPEFGLFKNKSLYNSIIEDPKMFDFMVNPQNYDFSNVFEDI
jgi:glucose-6-phosphate isomerase